MTREEAIEKLNNARSCPLLYESHVEALDMAIRALSQEPCEDILTLAERATTQVTEDMDNFIFTTIKPWCEEKEQRIISKCDLERALTQYFSKEPCDDAISRDAAINIASLHCLTIDETVKALEQLPSVNPQPCEDAISREDAEQMFRNIRSHLKPQDYKSAEEFNTRDLMLLNAEQMIHALPPVTQKSGKWIAQQEANGDDYFKAYDISGDMTYAAKYKCDKCGFIQICIEDHGQYKYCPNCGAKMESEDKE